MRWQTLASLLAVLGLLSAGCVTAGERPTHPPTAQAADDGFVVVIENLTVVADDGTPLPGLLGFPAPAHDVTRLVVFAHGYGHTVERSWVQHVEATVRADTAVVTTDYRDNLGFPVLRGAQDLIAATELALQRFPHVETVYLLGVSMGGAVAGTAIVESVGKGPGGGSLYDHWITVEGVSMLHETWLGAALTGHAAGAAIEREAGGTPLEVPEEYERRSPALRADEMAAGGLVAAAVIHGFNDGLVPYNQGREMASALVAADIPTRFYNVVRDGPEQTSGTTITGHVANALGVEDPNESHLHLAGHGSEADPHHPVIRTGFRVLNEMLDGDWPLSTYGESVVDDQS